MPPKVKFTKEEIIQAALDLVRKQGAEALTTRALGKRLGTSARPIFTAFENVEELQEEVKRAAKEVYAEYVKKGLEIKPAFKGVAKQYILFAKQEPKLFRLLFMSETMLGNTQEYNPLIADNYKTVFAAFKETYSLSEEETKNIYIHIGIYIHGLAALYAERMCQFPIEYIDQLLDEVDLSLLKQIKGHNPNTT